MSEVVTGVLKFAFGFISNKIRTYGAEKLQDGGLADQKFRGWIVRELDDIKFKLDANARKDLSASISFLKRGVERLHTSLDESGASENPSTSELPEDGKQSRATSSAQTKPAQKSVTVEDAIALANAIDKLKIESSKRFERAQESFKEAAKEATRAFHNKALSTEERILASKVRIASGILENLDDLEIAASDCLLYLRELHDMSAIKEIFAVHLQGGIKSFFKKASRLEIVETVTMINLILADFISKFTKRRMAVFDWPMIECGTKVVHPIHYEEESLQKLIVMRITPPWDKFVCESRINRIPVNVAINSKGDIIGVFCDSLRKLDRATGKWQPICLNPLPVVKNRKWLSLAIDDDDTMYVLAGEDSLSGPPTITLSVCSTDGNVISHCSLDFLLLPMVMPMYYFMWDPSRSITSSITVTKDKNIVICSKYTDDVQVCDSNGKLMKSFPIDTGIDSGYLERQYVSHKSDMNHTNEIIVLTRIWLSDGGYKINVYTQEGKLRKIIDFGPESGFIRDSTFCHVTKNYIVCKFKDDQTYVNCVSPETGELRNLLLFHSLYVPRPGDYYNHHLVSHRNGTIALVTAGCVLLLQSVQM